MRLAEIGDPVVVAAADVGEEVAVRDAIPEEPLARLQDRPPDAVFLVFDDHRLGVIGAFADILPEPEEIDLRGVLEALPGLHHRAQRADLLAVEHPGVVVAPAGGLAPFHPRRAVPELWRDAACVHVRRLDDMRVRGDQFPLWHYHLPRCRRQGCRSMPHLTVIASEAKQSRADRASPRRDCFVAPLLAMTAV